MLLYLPYERADTACEYAWKWAESMPIVSQEKDTTSPLHNGLYNCTIDDKMRVIAIDTSVAMAVVLGEPLHVRLLELTRGSILVAAPTLPWEVGNALTALFKQKRISLPDAEKVLTHFQRIAVQLVSPDIGKSVAIASKWNLYAYDAYVIECARLMKAPLLSLDHRQRVVAGEVGIEVLEV